ncbi:hypothetical protein E2986_05724 [Frieseomelitta varia]|uniref:Uncharacterized protein n=1 Tax=Frieseomelitta varia TaxID=561572 RepID=A0A833RIF7_9HYME|nr:hypothetical protein E2986_05724 [Frieseomelitta varia]
MNDNTVLFSSLLLDACIVPVSVPVCHLDSRQQQQQQQQLQQQQQQQPSLMNNQHQLQHQQNNPPHLAYQQANHHSYTTVTTSNQHGPTPIGAHQQGPVPPHLQQQKPTIEKHEQFLTSLFGMDLHLVDTVLEKYDISTLLLIFSIIFKHVNSRYMSRSPEKERWNRILLSSGIFRETVANLTLQEAFTYSFWSNMTDETILAKSNIET